MRGCQITHHFPCAIQHNAEVTLLEDKRIFCSRHVKDLAAAGDLKVHQPSFEVARCVYVDLGIDIPQRFRKSYAAHEVLIAIHPFQSIDKSF